MLEQRDTHQILLTGATGYIGGRLLGSLVAGGHRVRCMSRRPEHVDSEFAGQVDLVAGDVLDRPTLDKAFSGIDVAYYLIHSMSGTSDFEVSDRLAAENFADAARANGVRRIIYVGGLGETTEELSPHLRSRHEVGEILRQSGVEVIELRASVVIGSGSLSFEMVRSLVERLPVMITPRWVEVLAQPIAIKDLLSYLTASLDLPADQSRIFEIGGADQLSYGDMMREYARQRGLRRRMISVPVLTPRLSSLWLGLVTPLYSRVGRKLIDSIRHPTVVRDRAADEAFDIRPMSCRDAISEALRCQNQSVSESHDVRAA